MKYAVVATLIFSVALVAAQGCESHVDCDSCANDPSGQCGWCSPFGLCLNSTQSYVTGTGDKICTDTLKGTWIDQENATECAAITGENCTAIYGTDCDACIANPACGYCESAFFPAQCFQAAFGTMCGTIGNWNECPADNSTTTGEPSATTGEPGTTGEPSSTTTTTGSATTASESDSEGTVTVVSMILLVAMILVALF